MKIIIEFILTIIILLSILFFAVFFVSLNMYKDELKERGDNKNESTKINQQD